MVMMPMYLKPSGVDRPVYVKNRACTQHKHKQQQLLSAPMHVVQHEQILRTLHAGKSTTCHRDAPPTSVPTGASINSRGTAPTRNC
jgi:hypothetical protein